jgi:1,4-alpha-glucan branching enzyme
MAKETKPARRAPAKKAAPKKSRAVARKRVTFRIQSEPGRSVAVAGSFNNWDAGANILADKSGTGDYKAIILLAPGAYEYKFVINGAWCVDPACAEWMQNDMGTLNSVARV